MNLPAKILPQSTSDDLFESKEHYLAFRAAWSKAMNSERKHDLRADHHVLYLAARDRDFLCGFAPITRGSKLRGDYDQNPFRNAVRTLLRIYQVRKSAESMMKEEDKYGNHQRCVNHLLEPFEGTITPEMLIKIDDNIQNSYPEFAERLGARTLEWYKSGLSRFYENTKTWL